MAEILIALDEDARADRFLAEARELRRKWDAAYWVEDDGFYAMALDADKRPVRSISSNPGHALGAGLVPAASRAHRRRSLAVARPLLGLGRAHAFH